MAALDGWMDAGEEAPGAPVFLTSLTMGKFLSLELPAICYFLLLHFSAYVYFFPPLLFKRKKKPVMVGNKNRRVFLPFKPRCGRGPRQDRDICIQRVAERPKVSLGS